MVSWAETDEERRLREHAADVELERTVGAAVRRGERVAARQPGSRPVWPLPRAIAALIYNGRCRHCGRPIEHGLIVTLHGDHYHPECIAAELEDAARLTAAAA